MIARLPMTVEGIGSENGKYVVTWLGRNDIIINTWVITDVLCVCLTLNAFTRMTLWFIYYLLLLNTRAQIRYPLRTDVIFKYVLSITTTLSRH